MKRTLTPESSLSGSKRFTSGVRHPVVAKSNPTTTKPRNNFQHHPLISPYYSYPQSPHQQMSPMPEYYQDKSSKSWQVPPPAWSGYQQPTPQQIRFDVSQPPPNFPSEMSRPMQPPLPNTPPPPPPPPPVGANSALAAGPQNASMIGRNRPSYTPQTRNHFSVGNNYHSLNRASNIKNPGGLISGKPHSGIHHAGSDGPNGFGYEQMTHINKKTKRKAMSNRLTTTNWDRADAIKALALEDEYSNKDRRVMLILKFADPPLCPEIVKKFSSAISTVHFQQPATPRYCFVRLKEGSDVTQVTEEISQVIFGMGPVKVNRKSSQCDDQPTPEEIDPYTLYVGNISTKVTTAVVKDKFPKAYRIDIGYAQRMKNTRYAFVRYHNIEDAMEGYKETFNIDLGSRSLIVRFRRQKGNIGLPGESRVPNPPKQKPPKTSATSTVTTEANRPNENRTNITSGLENLTNTSALPDSVDSKENVLREARKLLSSMNSQYFTSKNQMPGTRIKQENDHSSDAQDLDEEIVGNGILGTRVKEEIFDEENGGEDNQYYEDLEDEEDLDFPSEEGDFPQEEFIDDKEEDDEDCNIYGARHWEQLQKEFNTVEKKPDIRLLSIDKTASTSSATKSSVKNDQFGSDYEKDDLDQLYKSLNSDHIDDDDDYYKF